MRVGSSWLGLPFMTLLAAACGDGDGYDEARYGALAASLCATETRDASPEGLGWRSLPNGSSFATSCERPEIPVCLGYEGDFPPIDGLGPDDRRAVQVYAETDDPSLGRSVALPIVDVAKGRVAVGRVPLLRSLPASGAFDLVVMAPGARNGWPPLDAERRAIAKRLEITPAEDADGSCIFTVVPPEQASRQGGPFRALCGDPTPDPDLGVGLSVLAPVVSPGREDVATDPAFSPSRPAHYWEAGRDVCHESVAVPLCVEVSDDATTRVVAHYTDRVGAARRVSMDVTDRNGGRFAFGRAVIPLGDRTTDVVSTFSLEAFAPGDDLRFTVDEFPVAVSPVPTFRNCDFY